jgi:hypothetical protein
MVTRRLRTPKRRVSIYAGQSTRNLSVTGGQGQDRTVDLPLFRRSVAFCPSSRRSIISPAHPHFRWRGCQFLRHGHGTTSAAVCRGMPFCPCYFGVDLRPVPGLCCFCVGAKAPDDRRRPLQPARPSDFRRVSSSRVPAPSRGCAGSAPEGDCLPQRDATANRPTSDRMIRSTTTHSNERSLANISKPCRTPNICSFFAGASPLEGSADLPVRRG